MDNHPLRPAATPLETTDGHFMVDGRDSIGSVIAHSVLLTNCIHLALLASQANIITVATLVTRTHKYNERDHHHEQPETLPKWFAKSGHVDVAPNKVKKNGAGKSNWGTIHDDIAGEPINHTQPRRRSNSSVDVLHSAGAFKTKFESVDPEPVFEEDIHGANAPDFHPEDEGYPLEAVSTQDSEASSEPGRK